MRARTQTGRLTPIVSCWHSVATVDRFAHRSVYFNYGAAMQSTTADEFKPLASLAEDELLLVSVGYSNARVYDECK
jgi:hypothetical protein